MEKNTTVICAIVKNEQRFIREWAEHYLHIGFDKLYVFEDFGSVSHKEQLNDYIRSGQVELIPLDTAGFIPHYERGTLVQRELYSRFLNKAKKEGLADWIGFFDVDEFMMFEEGWDLQSLEEEFKDCGGVLLSWRVYGANGHMKRPNGGVVESYTTHMPDGFRVDGSSKQWNVKSFVNVKHSKGEKHIHVFHGCRFSDNRSFKDGEMVYCKAWLNHYFTKSWEDYLDRIFARGNMHNNFRCLDRFFKCNPDMMSKKKEMCFAQRNRHCVSTMWISHDLKLISGGNESRLEELRKKYVENKKAV